MLLKESQNLLVSILIRRLDLGIRQITSGRHPAVDLIRVCLHMLSSCEIGFELLDIVSWLIARRKTHEWDFDLLCVAGVDHGGMDFGGGGEVGGCAAGECGDFSTPAVAEDTPFLDVGVLGLCFFDHGAEFLDLRRWCGLGLEEFAEFGFLVVGVRWEPADIGGFVAEPVGHEELVRVFLVGVGEDVGSLDGLWPVAEDVVDYENGGFGIGWTSGV